MSSEESRALVLKGEEADMMPKFAMLWVHLAGTNEEFWAECMQSHNGKTVFTNVRLKRVVRSSRRGIPRLHNHEVPRLDRRNAISLCTWGGYTERDEYHVRRPIRVVVSDAVKDVVGVESADQLPTWAVISREDAIKRMDERLDKSDEKTRAENARTFPQVVLDLVRHIKYRDYQARPWYRKLFGAGNKVEAAIEKCVRDRDQFYMECAAGVFRAENAVECDMEVLKEELGFLP